jgi:hypothetical protein
MFPQLIANHERAWYGEWFAIGVPVRSALVPDLSTVPVYHFPLSDKMSLENQNLIHC